MEFPVRVAYHEKAQGYGIGGLSRCRHCRGQTPSERCSGGDFEGNKTPSINAKL